MSSFLFNTYLDVNSSKCSQHLYLISCHPSFKCKVNEFLAILKDINTDNLVKLGSLFYALMLPDMPTQYVRELAIELYKLCEPYDGQIGYTTLLEYLLRMCHLTIENVDIKSAIGFLELLRSRITDTYIISSEKPELRKKVPYHLKLELFSSETVLTDSKLAEKHYREEMKHVYFEEKLFHSEESLQTAANEVIVIELKSRIEEVIPWGYICEDYLWHLVNNNFVSKNSYRLKKSKRLQIVEKLEYWIGMNEAASNLVRDYTVNQETFLTSGVLSAVHMPEELIPVIGKLADMCRINQTYSRKNYLQKLKDVAAGENCYYNILSEYFERDEFNIDELNLTREKLMVRRKESLLGISGRETIKKEVKDYAVEARNVSGVALKNLGKFWDVARNEATIKEMHAALRSILEEDKSVNSLVEKMLSEENKLPKDNTNPFMVDVLELAKKTPLQLLIIGRPKSGKSTLAKAIAIAYNLFYISIESTLNTLFERQKFFEENPPEVDDDGNPKESLSPLENHILSTLSQGKCCEEEDLLDLLNNKLEKEQTLACGFILDLPFEYNKYWGLQVVNNRLRLPRVDCRHFTHIIQTQMTEDQWRYFVEKLMERPEDTTISSAYDRYMLRKPKSVPAEDDEDVLSEGEAEKPAPLIEGNLLEVKCKDGSFSLLEHLTQHLHPNRYIIVHTGYQNVQECLGQLKDCLYRIPLPKKIEGTDKELLSVGLEEAKVFRQWSPWAMTDCVELSKQKLVLGKCEFAAEYAGRVFVFDNEVNLNMFLSNARRYLTVLPQLPKTTNIFITGPRKSGKKTIANMLAEVYGLKVVNVQDIIEQIIAKQRRFETHVPSNFDRRCNSIHLSEPEYKEFLKGAPINAKDILPMVLHHFGVTLQKKPVGWGIERTEEEGQESKEPEEKKPIKKPKKKERNAEEERPKTPPPEDLALKDVIPEINFLGKLDPIRGYIFVGYPNNEEQFNALKMFNIPIDKLIILSDNIEEAPNKILQTRLSDAELEKVAHFFSSIAPVKEALGEEICSELFINQTPEELLNRIRQIVDPFYLKVENDALNRVCADKQEDADPIPLGYCGEYCPVVLNEGFLIRGKEEFEAGLQGKRFKFVAEKELALFKENPSRYMHKEKVVVPPRIMFMGVRGVGLKTQLLKFNEKYRIPILRFKETLEQQLENEKNKRKTERYYNRGFKKPEFDEEGKQIEDAELNDDGPEFDRRATEIAVVRTMFDGINEILINGNFFDVEEEKVSTGIVELLAEARRLPEIVLMLISDEKKWLERVLDRRAIELELENIKLKRKEEKEREKNEARKKAQEAGEEYQEPVEEEDTEIPKLEDMIAQKEESLKAQRESDTGKLEELAEQFRSWNIEVVMVKCEREVKHVTGRINYVIKPVLEDRVSRWERNNMLSIEKHRAVDFVNNFIALESRFGKRNPFTLMVNPQPCPLVYKDRVYYLANEEERELVMKNPERLMTNSAVPQDVKFVAKVFVIGKTKTGKTTLVENLKNRFGFVRISIEDILENFVQEHEDYDIHRIVSDVRAGKVLTNEAIVTLIEKRTKMADCRNGWILDGLPYNTRQCELLNKKDIVPTVVISLHLSDLEIKRRVLEHQSSETPYDFDMDVVDARLRQNGSSIMQTEIYYLLKHKTVKTIEGSLSKWGIFECSRKEIELRVKATRNCIKDLTCLTACDVSSIGLSFNCIINNLSEYLNYCPISYKLRREYISICLRSYHHLALYNGRIYVFKGEKELADFVDNPETYLQKGPSFAPVEEVALEELQTVLPRMENKGYCMVELARKKMERGNQLFAFKWKQKYYMTATAGNLKAFKRNPVSYEFFKLLDKLPVEQEKKSELKKIAKKNDCSAFLEHHLSNIMMRSLAQLGYRRPKYPTLGSKESALKFLAMSLKANNPNKDEEYRQKCQEQLNKFIKECDYSQEIRDELVRKSTGQWQTHDEENLLKLCEEYHEFMKKLESTDKVAYFSQYIR